MQRPNVLFIIDDQHRHDWLGCAGAAFVQTPHLDRLAAEGRRFTHCFTNSPVCGPARTALATGLLPTRTGVTGNHLAKLPAGTPTVYSHFRDQGYRVALVGRHDLCKPGAPGSVHGNRPLNFSYGFTEALEVEGAMAAAGRDQPNGPYGHHLQRHGLWEAFRDDARVRRQGKWILGVSHDSVLPEEHNQDVFVADHAAARIRNIERDYPWFMFVSFQSPHDPFDPPARLARRYRDATLPEPEPRPGYTEPARVEMMRRKRISDEPPSAEQVKETRRQYAAKITLIDDQVGKLLAALEESGQAEQTIVVFCSDHGEMAGDRDLWIKHYAYEASWRVPLIMRGPGVATGESDALVELFDLYPTLSDLAGLEAPVGLDARSFVEVVRGDGREHRDHVVCMERCSSHGSYQAIRNRDRKLILTDDQPSELFHLDADPLEQDNRFAGFEGEAADLRELLTRRLVQA